MSYDNIKLWFAKTDNGKLITIDEINETNKYDTYYCPMCNSSLIPKATKSMKVSSHFAHVDVSKCTSETMIHFWFKHKFLEQGNKFSVAADKEVEYICKEVLVEQSCNVGDQRYRPDVTIVTECGKTIYFEMNYSNKKKIKDYLDIWIELKNIVVEIDIKSLMMKDEIPKFKALFYDGKCFNVKKNDVYYNTIGKYKEEKLSEDDCEELKSRIQKLDWFWDDISKYKNGEHNISYMAEVIDEVMEYSEHLVKGILRKSMCVNLYRDYKKYISRNEKSKFSFLIEDSHILNEYLNIFSEKTNSSFDSFKIELVSKYCSKSVSYFHGSRKHPYKYKDVFSHYEYCFNVKYNNRNMDTIFVTNKLLDSTKEQFLEVIEKTLKGLMKEKITNECRDCKNNYSILFEEVKFFLDKGLSIPRRCKQCREKRKNKEG